VPISTAPGNHKYPSLAVRYHRIDRKSDEREAAEMLQRLLDAMARGD
jgi:hypothetical protein